MVPSSQLHPPSYQGRPQKLEHLFPKTGHKNCNLYLPFYLRAGHKEILTYTV